MVTFPGWANWGVGLGIGMLAATTARAGDLDGDGVDDARDICNNTPPGLVVDYWGRPYADFDQECDVDLADFAFFFAGFTGVLPRPPFLTSPDLDTDGDGVSDGGDVCDNTPPGIIVDFWGRPYTDFDHDCDADVVDFAFLQMQFTGELAGCPEGSSCDDGLDCTINDVCVGNVCLGQPMNALCADGLYCNGPETCAVQVGCLPGTAVDCSEWTDACNVGVCSEALDACVAQPANTGQPCSDGLFCTTGETCQAGVCADGAATDCSALNDDCNVGVCNEVLNRCERSPANPGAACADGLFCTVGETCTAGTCGGGQAYDCSALDGQCTLGTCNEQFDECRAVPAHEGAACDDGLFCTEGETCLSGVCGSGQSIDCSDLDGQCLLGQCSEEQDTCVESPRPNGTGCNDASVCTIGDHCTDGNCGGTPLADRTTCDDADPETNRSVCVSGQCVPSTIYTPSSSLTYSCAFGGIFFSVSSFEFADDGATLTVWGAPATMTGPGGIQPNGSFAVSGSTVDGACTKVFYLSGQFNGPIWTGQFRAQFFGCGSCGWPTWNGVVGTPQS